MSNQHNDAVFDRVLTRIVSAGNQKTQAGRSPARGFGSITQRDAGTSRSISGVDKRRAASAAKLHATYRFGNATFGSATSRDSSLAGTNTVVPQIVFSKSILKVSGPLLLPLPASSSSAAAGPSASALPASAGATNRTSAVILRQQSSQPQSSQLPRPGSSQPPLRTGRCSSPSSHVADLSARSRNSARENDTSNGGGGGGSPRILRPGVSGGAAEPRLSGAGRSRSSPREHVFGDGGVSPRDARGPAGARALSPGAPRLTRSPEGAGTAARRTTVHGEPPTASIVGAVAASASAAAASEEGGAGAQRASSRGANTITRTAALRALKQQRATTPDLLAEMREAAAARVSSAGGTSQSSGAQDGLTSDLSFTDRSSRMESDRGAADGVAGGGGGATSAQSGRGPQPSRAPAPTRHTTTSNDDGDAEGTSPAASAAGDLSFSQGPQEHNRGHRREEQNQAVSAASAARFEPGRLRPLPEAGGSGGDSGEELYDGQEQGDAEAALSQSFLSITARPATLVSAASGCWGSFGGWGQEASVRSPSPRRNRGPACSAAGAGPAGWMLAGGGGVGVTQRQQRAMHQHLKRQTSPSPGRRQGQGPAARTVSPTKGLQAGLVEGGWQSDIMLAAQARIRRLEDQVVSLTAQVAELQASHADLEFQLEEEQQQGRKAAAAAGLRASVKGSPGRGGAAAAAAAAQAAAEAAQREQQQLEQQLKEAQEQVQALQQQLQAREAEAGEQAAKARAVNETLAQQNRALYSTLEETLSAAEHAAQELKQLRTAHAQLQAAQEASQREVLQLRENLDLRERAMSAVQVEFSALRRRHDEVLAAAEAARRDSALRDGRLRREVEAATQEAAAIAAQLAKLQREHQQLHCRKAEKDRQLAALAKRAETQQEQLVSAERLVQDQAALVRELESRATLLRNRNAAMDKAVSAEKEARQAAQEQVRQMEEEIALLVAIVRQSDPTLETLARYKADPSAAAAMAAAAAAAAAAALLQLSPSPTRGSRPSTFGGSDGMEALADAAVSGGGAGAGAAAGRSSGPSPRAVSPRVGSPRALEHSSSGRGASGRRSEGYRHSVMTITPDHPVPIGNAGVVEARPVQSRGPVVPAPPRTAPPPLPGSIVPGSAPLVVRAPPPGASHPAASPRAHAADPSSSAADLAPSFTATDDPASAAGIPPDNGPFQRPHPGSRDTSPLALLYPAKHSMTGGVFLAPSGRANRYSTSPRIGGSPGIAGMAPAHGRSRSAGGGVAVASVGGSPRWGGAEEDGARLSSGGAGGNNRRSKTPPGVRTVSPPTLAARGRRGSDSGAGPDVARGPAAPDAAAPRGGDAATRTAPNMRRRTASPSPPGNNVSSTQRASSPNHWVQAEQGGGGTASSPTHMEETGPGATCETDGDKVFWAQPRRSSRSASTGSAVARSKAVATSRPGGGAEGVAGGPQEVLGYAALSARKALAAASPPRGADEVGASGADTSPRETGGSARKTMQGGRRARTPEPRTVADWAKLAAGDVAAADTAGRKRSSTPDGRTRGSVREPHPPAYPPFSAVEVGREGVAELAALLLGPGSLQHQQHQQQHHAYSLGRSGGGAAGGFGEHGGEDNDAALSGSGLGAVEAGLQAVILADEAARGGRRRSGDSGEELVPGGALRKRSSGGAGGSRRVSIADPPSQPADLPRGGHGSEAPQQQSSRPPQHRQQQQHDPHASGPTSTSTQMPPPSAAGLMPRPSVAQQKPPLAPIHLHATQVHHGPDSTAAASPRSGGGASTAAGSPRGSAFVDDPLGAALRSMQQRQAQLLVQLAAARQPGSSELAAILGGAGPGPAPPPPLADSTAMLVPLAMLSPPNTQSPVAPQQPVQQPSTPPAARTADSPAGSSFSFHMSHPPRLLESGQAEEVGPMEVAPGLGAADTWQLGGNDAGEDAMADRHLRSPPRRRSGEQESACQQLQQQQQIPTRLQLGQQQQQHEQGQRFDSQPAVFVQPSPLRTPRRLSVAAAAAAAAAASGGGVVGPLTALLDQLESAGDTWRTATRDTAAAATAAGGGAVTTATITATSTTDAPPSPQPATALAVVSSPAMVTAVDEAILLPSPRHQQQQHQRGGLQPDQAVVGPYHQLAAVLGSADGTVGEDKGGDFHAGKKGGAVGPQPVVVSVQSHELYFSTIADEEVVPEEGEREEEEGEQEQQGEEDRAAANPGQLNGHPTATEMVNREEDQQPPDSRHGSQGGGPAAELSGGFGADGMPASLPSPAQRLGVSLYDNVAYDVSTRPSTTGDVYDSLSSDSPVGGASDGSVGAEVAMSGQQHPWDHAVGPVCVPTSLGAVPESPATLSDDVSDEEQGPSSLPPSPPRGPPHCLDSGEGAGPGSGSLLNSISRVLSDADSAFLGRAPLSVSRLDALVLAEDLAHAGEAASVVAVAGVGDADMNTGAGAEEERAAGSPMHRRSESAKRKRMWTGSPEAPAAAGAAAVAAPDRFNADGDGDEGEQEAATAASTAETSLGPAGAAEGDAGLEPSGLQPLQHPAEVEAGQAVAPNRLMGAATALPSAPMSGASARWSSRTEPLLNRTSQQQPLLSRPSIGAISSGAGVGGGGGGAGSASSSGAAGGDWLQSRRPQSPSVKPLSLAEVLRRPSNSAR